MLHNNADAVLNTFIGNMEENHKELKTDPSV